ncbi:MAG TPA: carbamoyl-phosphate synthase small subunit, partial [Chromatiaceae bacterium]|nr:carbamoyl-phosphate synthase small subunit [Chromatiaceae bacterium]
MTKKAILVLEDGTVFHGRSIGMEGQTVGEVVFNTAMTGYQEILTDPSYRRQIVTLTYPHIGNTGTNGEDYESGPRHQVHAAGLVIRDLPLLASNWRSSQSLEEYLRSMGVIAISDVDTRRLTRILREKGAQAGCIQAGSHLDEQVALATAETFPGLKGMDLAKEVTTADRYVWDEGSWDLAGGFQKRTVTEDAFQVVAYDYGIKTNILRMLRDRNCRITVVPAQTPARE